MGINENLTKWILAHYQLKIGELVYEVQTKKNLTEKDAIEAVAFVIRNSGELIKEEA